jgi:hypothetical protein
MTICDGIGPLACSQVQSVPRRMWSIEAFELDDIWSTVIFEPSVPLLSGPSMLSVSIDVILEPSLCIDLLEVLLRRGVLGLAPSTAASPGGSRRVLSGIGIGSL